jgi:hypothetical protein
VVEKWSKEKLMMPQIVNVLIVEDDPLWLNIYSDKLASSLSERTLLAGDKGRQNNNFNKNISQMSASGPNC